MDKQSIFPTTHEIATSARSLDFYSMSYLPNPDPVLKKLGKDNAVYKNLLGDAWIGGCMLSRRAAVRVRRWEIDRGRTKTNRTREIERIFKDLDVRGILSNVFKAIPFGYQPLEILWHNTGSMIVPRAVVAKPRSWFVFDANNRLRFRSRSSDITGEAVPDRKFLIAQHEPAYDNPYGVPVLSSCFWPGTFKKAGFKFLMTFAEKYGMPWLIGKVPRGAVQDVIDAMRKSLEAMVHDAIAIIPEDSSIEALPIDMEGSGDTFLNLIDACRSDISVAILGYNLETVSKKRYLRVRSDVAESDARFIEDQMNQLIAWICELNWSTAVEIPRFSLYKETDIGLPQAKVDLLRTKMGLRFSKKYFMKTYGFEEEDIEVIPSGPLEFEFIVDGPELRT